MFARAFVLGGLAFALSSCGPSLDTRFDAFCEAFLLEMGEPGHPECEDPDAIDAARKKELVEAYVSSKEHEARVDELFEQQN